MTTIRNKVQLIGNLGNNPEIIAFEGDRKLAKMSIATNESYKNKAGERITNTQWHNVVAFGPVAEIIEKYIKKGQEVAIEGKLNNKTYEDKEGKTRYVTEIIADQIQMLGKKDA